MAIVTLKNDFHNTRVSVRVAEQGAILSPTQRRRVERALCGMADCECGTIRGDQDLPEGWAVDGYWQPGEIFVGPRRD
jgi:hypothetical protein